MMTCKDDRISEIRDRADKLTGKNIGTSSWIEVTQDMTNEFARATKDLDPAHIDPDWAEKNSAFGQTIAFGFQTLSMLSAMAHDIGFANEVMGGAAGAYPINYGLDKVRFMSPVPVGTRIRAHVVLLGVEERKPGQFLLNTEVTIEIENKKKPALIAEWKFMMVLED